jgi:murein L,D-transpeptidase YcbB/YkuD
MGLEVKRGPDGHINVVQPPGAANAFGRIKFAFSNKFQVYLHDTPEKRLFGYQQRAFSHGCMRVENPTKFGEVMLSLTMREPMPNAQQISTMFGREEQTFRLEKRPMVPENSSAGRAARSAQSVPLLRASVPLDA